MAQFDSHRFQVAFTTSDLDTVASDKNPRHAVIEEDEARSRT